METKGKFLVTDAVVRGEISLYDNKPKDKKIA